MVQKANFLAFKKINKNSYSKKDNKDEKGKSQTDITINYYKVYFLSLHLCFKTQSVKV